MPCQTYCKYTGPKTDTSISKCAAGIPTTPIPRSHPKNWEKGHTCKNLLYLLSQCIHGKAWLCRFHAQLRKEFCHYTVCYAYICAGVSTHMQYGCLCVRFLWYEYVWFEITRAMPGYAWACTRLWAWWHSLVPRPHLRERVWWHPADSSGFINIDYFLERNISPPITLQKRQSVVQYRKFLASLAQWHSTFLARKLVIGSQLCIQQAMNF